MATARGYSSKLILGLESEWGILPIISTGTLYPFISESLVGQVGRYRLPLARGQVAEVPSVSGLKEVTGNVETTLSYNLCDYFLAAALDM